MTFWALLSEFYDSTISLFFFVLAFILFLIAYRGYKSNNKYGGSSTITCGVFFLFFGYYNALVKYFPYPYNGFMVWWMAIVLGIYLLFALVIRRVKRKEDFYNNPKSQERDLEEMSLLARYIFKTMNRSQYEKKISIKMEAIRKSFHLAGLLIILTYFGFFFIPPLTSIINNMVIFFINDTEWVYSALWGDVSMYPYILNDFQAIVDLTMFGLIAALVFMIIPEMIRVMWGSEYSMFNFLTKAVLRSKEHNAVGPQIYLITGVIFSYILYMIGLVSINIVFAGILVACFSDALAALVGRIYGKHKVQCIGGEEKSVEGFIAGSGSAYFISLFFVGPLYALFVAFIFFLLDYFPLVIADNILNPIVITVALFIVQMILSVPVKFLL